MAEASLPVDLSADLANLEVSYSRDTGVHFRVPSGGFLDVSTVFRSRLYWVNGGGSLPVLPNFHPTADSVILESKLLHPNPPICHPFPKYFTFENVDRAVCGTRLGAIILRILPQWLQDLIEDIQELVLDFFASGLGIYCSAGDMISIAADLPDGTGAGFWVRTWSEAGEELIYPHVYLHQLRFIESTIPDNNPVYDQLQYGIGDSVGPGSATNDPADVFLVKKRLHDLGFRLRPSPPQSTWPGGNPPAESTMTLDSNYDTDLARIIELFQAIVRGRRAVASDGTSACDLPSPRPVVDGRIDRKGLAERWLWAANVPTWSELESGHGYENKDVATDNEHDFEHDYGSNFLKVAIREAGRYYMRNHWWRNLTAAQQANHAVIRTNDASWPRGGDTDEHGGHETGLDVDVKLPANDGTAPGLTIGDARYDRSTARAICQAFASRPDVHRIRFNDPTIYSGSDPVSKVILTPGHSDHMHVDVCPPGEPIPWSAGLAGAP